VQFSYEHLRGHLNDPTAMRAELRKMLVDPDYQESGRMEGIAAFAALLGDTDMALAAQRRTYVDLAGNNAGDLWFPIYESMRSDPRFKKILRDLGLVDYWRTSGNWGDYCKPVGTDDFECH
jgi:hypothetical protein